MIRYLIVDDEPIAHEIIEDYSKLLPHLTLVHQCYDAFQAIQFLSKHEVDLIFLDLNMPKLKGFDFLKTLRHPPKVIVTTAYSEFAIESYELDVVDYLLKPFSFERFAKAVNKIRFEGKQQRADTLVSPNDSPNVRVDQRVDPIPNNTPTENPQRIFLKSDKKYHQIALDEILYIEAYGNYCKVYLEDEMIMTSQKISSFESILPSNQFLRVHKSFIVAIQHIKLIEGNRITIHTSQVPIGKVYKLNVNRLVE